MCKITALCKVILKIFDISDKIFNISHIYIYNYIIPEDGVVDVIEYELTLECTSPIM